MSTLRPVENAGIFLKLAQERERIPLRLVDVHVEFVSMHSKSNKKDIENGPPFHVEIYYHLA